MRAYVIGALEGLRTEHIISVVVWFFRRLNCNSTSSFAKLWFDLKVVKIFRLHPCRLFLLYRWQFGGLSRAWSDQVGHVGYSTGHRLISLIRKLWRVHWLMHHQHHHLLLLLHHESHLLWVHRALALQHLCHFAHLLYLLHLKSRYLILVGVIIVGLGWSHAWVESCWLRPVERVGAETFLLPCLSRAYSCFVDDFAVVSVLKARLNFAAFTTSIYWKLVCRGQAARANVGMGRIIIVHICQRVDLGLANRAYSLSSCMLLHNTISLAIITDIRGVYKCQFLLMKGS